MSYITREGKFTCNKHALQKHSSTVYETEQQDWHTLRFAYGYVSDDNWYDGTQAHVSTIFHMWHRTVVIYLVLNKLIHFLKTDKI